MTNFEPLKQKIWESAKADNKTEFDNNCEALMTKACEDWWRIGWSIAPNDINDVYKMLDSLMRNCHEAWLKAMECGDAPNEDVSPGEGFALVKKVIQEAVEREEPENDRG